jgi:hypothetical protein
MPLNLAFGTQVENRVIHKRGVLSSPAAKDGETNKIQRTLEETCMIYMTVFEFEI